MLVGVDYGGVVVFCFGGARERLTWKRRDSVPHYRHIGIIHTGCGCLMIKRDRILRTWIRSVSPDVDLHLSLSPDVFGIRAFDDKLPLTRMLPDSNPCELRLLLPDSKIARMGFTMSLWKTCPRILHGARVM